jgi:predicted nucleotidyltransferase
LKVAGIVSEYNPFHNGHKYHIEKTASLTGCDLIVSVMSGSFVQRGEPAIFDKWSRAGIAVSNGVDLVIELPAYYSLQSAEGFAFGAVSILGALGTVDYLSFGSECGCIEKLCAAAKVLNDENVIFKAKLKEHLSGGLSFAAAREKALEAVSPALSGLLKNPNNILGIEYIRSLQHLKSSIKPVTLKRCDNGYHSLNPAGSFASATNIRSLIQNGEDVSCFVPEAPKSPPQSLTDFEEIILYAVLRATKQDISLISSGRDGVLNRILSADTSSLQALLSSIKTRRIPMSRIKRTLINLTLGINSAPLLPPSYIRVLAMNKKGAALIKQTQLKAALPIIIKPSSYKKDDFIWEIENTATDIYFLPLRKGRGLNLTTSPVVTK